MTPLLRNVTQLACFHQATHTASCHAIPALLSLYLSILRCKFSQPCLIGRGVWYQHRLCNSLPHESRLITYLLICISSPVPTAMYSDQQRQSFLRAPKAPYPVMVMKSNVCWLSAPKPQPTCISQAHHRPAAALAASCFRKEAGKS